MIPARISQYELELMRKNALMRATLREILRIVHAAEQLADQVSFNDALDGRLAQQWADIMGKAERLAKES